MHARADEPRMTVEEFLDAYGGREGKWELVDGEVVAMAGGTVAHALIAANLIAALRPKLRGGPCLCFGSDMGLAVSDHTYRLPDVAIYCDERDVTPERRGERKVRYPRVVFEILSRSTERTDKGDKFFEYRLLPSIDTIVWVHPEQKRVVTFERVGPLEWRDVILPPDAPLRLRDPAVEITAEEIFADV